MPGVFGAAPSDAPAAFEAICRYTYFFLERYVKGDVRAEEFLMARPEANGLPRDLLSIERLPARAPALRDRGVH